MYQRGNRSQMTIEDFIVPFGGKLDVCNRWVKMAELMPWDMIEDIYAKTFKDSNTDG
ncbi:MAG: IS5/IS1182 family transposase, partial [Oscillospiraceae bacterium]|nr:IS5/IS1182 family transposase [Oscillospiraceae bacterium]